MSTKQCTEVDRKRKRDSTLPAGHYFSWVTQSSRPVLRKNSIGLEVAQVMELGWYTLLAESLSLYSTKAVTAKQKSQRN
jgi:hypothetical protein